MMPASAGIMLFGRLDCCRQSHFFDDVIAAQAGMTLLFID
jgi:hypothetical protein